jgi:hypothetical protein
MASIRALHVAADNVRKRHTRKPDSEIWDGWSEFYDAGRELREAALLYTSLLSTKNYDRLIAAALACHATDKEAGDATAH